MKLTAIIILISILMGCKTNQLAIVKINGKVGCIDRKGTMVIQPTWDWILQGTKDELLLVEKDSLYGYIDNIGNIIIKPQYKEGELFKEGLAAVSNGKKYGFINPKGDTIIPFLFDDIFAGFHNGLSDVTIGDSSGYIDKKGNVVIPIKYNICYPFTSSYAQVQTFNGDNLLVDKSGKTYEEDNIRAKHRLWIPREVYPGSFTTKTGQGRINSKGDTIVPPVYAVTGNLSNHMYIVQDKSGKWGAYNDKGVLTVLCMFDYLWHFYEGLASFKLDGKWGYVDRHGIIVIKPSFEHATQFTDGLAYVEVNGKSGFINKKGVFVIAPKFDTYIESRFQ